jgi:hypothetical protein
MVSVSSGELVGFCFPALVGGLLREETPQLVLGAMVLAGAAEGTVLGWSQARVLRYRLLGLDERRWVAATAFAAAAAWFVGMLPSTFYGTWSAWPTPVVALVFAAGGAFVLLVIGAAQWLELRRHVPHAARWIAVTAAGWGAGLLVFTAVTTPLWQPGQGTPLIAAIGVVGGGLMAVTMAAVTGVGLRRLLADPRPPDTEAGRHRSEGAGSGVASLSLAGGTTKR